MTEHRFPPPRTVEKIPAGFKVCDTNGQSLACVYSREKLDDAHMAKVLAEDEAPHSLQHRQAPGVAGWKLVTASAGIPLALTTVSLLSRVLELGK
jgi:uncharacterized protein YbdZ (MbtH family)